MKKIDISPLALSDLQIIRQGITMEFGGSVSNKAIKKLMSSIRQLEFFPDSGLDVTSRFGIDCDYRCLITGKNYVFYRIEGESIHVIRVLDERQDFMNILFGIKTTSQETEDYWEE